jgi:type I restriction enzyme S subunit
MQSFWRVISVADRFVLTPMKAFLEPRKEFFVIDDTRQYKRVTARLHAGGIVLRDEVYGSQLRTKEQQATKAGDLLVAEIDAKVGGVGIVPPELSGAIVSSHYFLYEIDETICHPNYLEYYIRSGAVEEQFQEFVRGSTNYASIRAHHTLELQIPLPPLDEQRRIVARIEELAALIEEARELRVKAREEAGSLLGAMSSRLFDTAAALNPNPPIGDVISFRNDLIRPTDGKYGALRFVGLQHIESHTGKKIGEDWLLAEELEGRKFRFSSGEIVYGYLRPYLNKVWVADCEGVCSVDQYVIQLKPGVVDAKYLAYFMRSPIFLRQAIDLTHNLLLPRLRTSLLKSIPTPLPTVPEQHRIVAYLDGLQAQVDELTATQDVTQVELDALLPSVLDQAFQGES